MKRSTRTVLSALAAVIAATTVAVLMTPLGPRGDRPAIRAIVNARVLAEHSEAKNLLIRDGHIEALDAAIPEDAAAFDAGGRFVVPGLINVHTHMFRAGGCGRNEGVSFENVAQIPLNFDVALRAGNTTVVDLGAPLHGAVRFRDLFQRERARAPRLLVAGPVLTAPGGYPFDWADRELVERFQVVKELPDEATARAVIDALAEARVDVVKIATMELAYNEQPLPAIAPAVFRAAVAAAHARKLRVFVHAHSNAAYRDALDAGADVIAHSSFESLPDELVDRVATSSVVVVPTLWVFAAYKEAQKDATRLLDEAREQLMPGLYDALLDFHERHTKSGDDIPPDFLRGLKHSRLEAALKNARDNLRRMKEAGVTIGFGTDTSFCYALQGAAHHELEEMAAAGMTPAEVFAAATRGSAQAIARDDLGVIKPGAIADLLVLDRDPREDPRALAKPHAVVRDGVLIEEPATPPGFLRTLRALFTMLWAIAGD